MRVDIEVVEYDSAYWKLILGGLFVGEGRQAKDFVSSIFLIQCPMCGSVPHPYSSAYGYCSACSYNLKEDLFSWLSSPLMTWGSDPFAKGTPQENFAQPMHEVYV